MMSESRQEMTLALRQKAILGECLIWNAQQSSWCWTDIESSCLYQWRENDQSPDAWEMTDRVGSFALCRSGKVLLGMSHSLALYCRNAGQTKLMHLVDVEADMKRTRINDGRTDRRGFFVFGTLDEGQPQQAIGHFYQYSRQYGLRRLDLPKAAISNSICFSLDGQRMYFTDTVTRVIYRCDYDAESAQVGNLQRFVSVADASPDGSIIDRDGCLWNAQWGAGRVVQYSPSGEKLRTVYVPVKNPTCPAFGGPELDQLMVTSSCKDMTSEEALQMPEAGSLFRLRLEKSLGVVDALFDDE